MTGRRTSRPATIAALVVVWTLAWSAPMGRVTWDTKYDLLLDPWGLMQRALHLWDPQVAWGGLSNQGYGYLFPMGPFFALGSEIAPVWVVQRLWWMFLLTLGFIGALGLLRELRLGTEQSRLVGALAWVLAPKVVTSVGILSAEIQPQILVPLILWPVVRGWRGKTTPLRASALSGLAILLSGGVNATATLLALVPTGLFLVTRPHWWRLRLTWLWLGSTVLATAWWLGPLLLMSRYAPTFLDWIETARAVSAPITLLDVLRGTTHWLGHLLTPGGPWWPAGYELSTSALLIVLTAVVAAIGLAGVALRSFPHRRFAWALLIPGIVALSLPHSGPLGSPVEGLAQALLDGALSPFRNIHKTDALVRLPLMLGVVHLVGRLQSRRPAGVRAPFSGRMPSLAAGAAAVLVVLAAAPAFTGAVVARGGHEETARHWSEAGAWLDARGGEGSVVVPAASFGEYRWGRTIDEPLRSLTSAPYAVRDAVPLTPPGAIRLLDELEMRLQTGRSIDGSTDVLRRAGIRYIVLRNDLATWESGQPPAALARSALRSTPEVTLAKGFGRTFTDVSGERVRPVEIYELTGVVAGPFTAQKASTLVSATGSGDDLHTLADAGLGDRTVIFDADRSQITESLPLVLTDGTRARERYFGSIRGEDATATLAPRDLPGTRDYRPAGDEHLSFMSYPGLAALEASSSLGQELSFAGLAPAMRPFAALDGRSGTGWLTMWDEEPTLTITLADPAVLDAVTVEPFVAAALVPGRLDVATEIEIETETGSMTASLDGPTLIDLEPGPTSVITIRITDTASGDPSSAITGLAEVTVPGLVTSEVLELVVPEAPSPVSALVLGAGLAGRDGCLAREGELLCLAGETIAPESQAGTSYLVPRSTGGDWLLSGTLRTVTTDSALYGSPDVKVSATSSRTTAAPGAPASIVDRDVRTAWSPGPGDREPRLTFDFPQEQAVESLAFETRGSWMRRARPMVHIEAGATDVTQRLQPDGTVSIPRTITDRVRVTFLPVPGEDIPALAGMELAEVHFGGAAIGAAQEQLLAECGSGPVVTVNDQQVATRAEVDRTGWLGLAPIHWQACDAVTLRGADDTVSVSDWRGMAPARTLLLRDATILEATAPESLDGEWQGPNTATVSVPEAAEGRVLGLLQNTSPGWRASLGASDLDPVTLDGHRQGFIIPAGQGGTVEITFAPDRLHRLLLLGGLVLALVLLVVALAPSRIITQPGPAGGSPRSRHVSTRLVGVGAIGLAFLVAGPVGGLAALAALVIAGQLHDTTRVWLVVGLPVASALAAAIIAPESAGPPWLEGAIRVALIIALVMAAAPRESRGEARGGQLDEAVAGSAERKAEGQPHG